VRELPQSHSPKFPAAIRARATPLHAVAAAPRKRNESLTCRTQTPPQSRSGSDAGVSRRSFCNLGGVDHRPGCAGREPETAARMNDFPAIERFMQKYYKELTPEEMKKVLTRIENDVEQQYGIRPHVRDLKRWMAWSCLLPHLTRCIGCRKCVMPAWRKTTSRAIRKSNTSAFCACRTVRSTLKRRAQLRPESVPERATFTCRCNASSARIAVRESCPVHATCRSPTHHGR